MHAPPRVHDSGFDAPPATTTHSITVRSPTVDDAAAMWSLARDAVDENSPYAYLMMCEYFAATCVVAHAEAVDDTASAPRLVGFVTGFHPPEDPATTFVWQIVVGADARGTGLGGRLLDELVERHRRDQSAPPDSATYIEATVTPDNAASQRLFRALARRHGTDCVETPCFATQQFPAGAGHHEPEVRHRIGPL